MKILFICLSGLKFNVRTPLTEPLGGTESAIAYLAVALHRLDHDVTIMCNVPGPVELDGVKHVPVFESPELLRPLDPDVVIVSSAPHAFPPIRDVLPRAKRVLWNQMRPDQPAMQPIFNPILRATIEHIVYVSESQRQAFATAANNTPVRFDGPGTTVIGNAIAPAFESMFISPQEILETKKCRGAYTSTPFRGLEYLAHLRELPIDVFSSMKVYQADDAAFANLYQSLKSNDQLVLHGSVRQRDLKTALREIAFLVYPCIFAECHSIAIIEAMAAGLKVVTTDMAVEPMEFIDIMPLASGSLDAYLQLLRKNIDYFRTQPEAWAQERWKQIQFINETFTWTKRALEWEKYLREIVAES